MEVRAVEKSVNSSSESAKASVTLERFITLFAKDIRFAQDDTMELSIDLKRKIKFEDDQICNVFHVESGEKKVELRWNTNKCRYEQQDEIRESTNEGSGPHNNNGVRTITPSKPKKKKTKEEKIRETRTNVPSSIQVTTKKGGGKDNNDYTDLDSLDSKDKDIFFYNKNELLSSPTPQNEKDDRRKTQQRQKTRMTVAKKRQLASRVTRSKKRKDSSQKGQPLCGPNKRMRHIGVSVKHVCEQIEKEKMVPRQNQCASGCHCPMPHGDLNRSTHKCKGCGKKMHSWMCAKYYVEGGGLWCVFCGRPNPAPVDLKVNPQLPDFSGEQSNKVKPNCNQGQKRGKPITPENTPKKARRGIPSSPTPQDEKGDKVITNPNDNLIPGFIDHKLTDKEREKRRKARLAAAKRRQKASGVPNPKPKKKSSKKGQPLRGPNSKCLMKWQM